MSNTYIIPTKIFEQLNQRARKLKRSEGIPHHEALEKVAKSLRFENWHQVTLAAEETRVAETARRYGLIIALDIKDALEYNFDHDGVFAQDDRLMSFCESDLFQNYCLSKDDDGRTFESTSTPEELREDFEADLDNVVLYRYTRQVLPATLADALALSRERCFFAPTYIWYRGQFIDVFDHVSHDGVTMQW